MLRRYETRAFSLATLVLVGLIAFSWVYLFALSPG